MVATDIELTDHQLYLFTRLVKPGLTMDQLQTLEAFVSFQKAGDTVIIPGTDESHHRITSIGKVCQACGSRAGRITYADCSSICEYCATP